VELSQECFVVRVKAEKPDLEQCVRLLEQRFLKAETVLSDKVKDAYQCLNSVATEVCGMFFEQFECKMSIETNNPPMPYYLSLLSVSSPFFSSNEMNRDY
jgi:hypothetical protein